jgi:transposase
LQALHRVRERLVRQRTGIINQIRAFLLKRGIAVRQGWRFLRTELPGILAQCSDVLSLRMIRIIQDQARVWRRLDERIEGLSTDVTRLVELEPACARLKTVPGTRPITSSVMVAIGTGDVFSNGRDFAAWLGLVPRQIWTGDRANIQARQSLSARPIRAGGLGGADPAAELERYGLSPRIEAAEARCTATCWRSRSPIS